MRKLSLSIYATAMVAFFCGYAARAQASTFLMVGPHAPAVGYTPHIGPVGFHASRQSQSSNPAIRDSAVLQSDIRRMAAEAHKLRCRELHVAYVARHGITTPQPLKGFSGCQKYALDNSYWRQRRYGIGNLQNPLSSAILTLQISIQDLLVW